MSLIGTLLGYVLTAFLLLLIARLVLDSVGTYSVGNFDSMQFVSTSASSSPTAPSMPVAPNPATGTAERFPRSSETRASDCREPLRSPPGMSPPGWCTSSVNSRRPIAVGALYRIDGTQSAW